MKILKGCAGTDFVYRKGEVVEVTKKEHIAMLLKSGFGIPEKKAAKKTNTAKPIAKETAKRK